jgi:hypothetical protein
MPRAWLPCRLATLDAASRWRRWPGRFQNRQTFRWWEAQAGEQWRSKLKDDRRKFPALQNPLPSLRGAKPYYSTMIGLNLWQKPQQGRRGAGTLREPNYASQAILSVTAANAAAEEANFGTCRSAATVRYLFRSAHEFSGAAGYVVEVGHNEFVTAP